MKQIFLWVAEGKTLVECARLAECHVSQIRARFKKYPRYKARYEEALQASADAHVQAAMDALDLSDKEVIEAGKSGTAIVAARKAKADLRMRLAKAADRDRFAEYVKPVAPLPSLIIAINGIDIFSRKSVVSEMEAARIDAEDQAPILQAPDFLSKPL